MSSTSPFSVLRPSLLSDALGVPSTRVPVDLTTFACYVIPPTLCFFVLAVLALKPQTRAIRVALWPVVALLALRAALSVDMSLGKPERKFLNIDLVLSMVSIVTRTLDWTLAEEPLVRHVRPTNSVASIYVDALDLASNLRGHGWNWSQGLYVPRETRPTKSRVAFAFRAFLSMIAYGWMCGTLHRAVLSFFPAGTTSISEVPTIFDHSLPLVLRYLRSSVISVTTAFAIYAVLQMGYDLCIVPAVLVFGQDPAQWPPAFDAPWCATSLTEFWGRRWHQWFRRTFLLLGGRPLSLLLGRAGQVLGSFLASAIFHHIAVVTLDDRAEPWRMVLGFGMMAPGIMAERAFLRWTGRRVDGAVGWVWMMAWMVLWGNVITEGFARAGMFGCSSFIDSALPVRLGVERLVVDFDRWLHTI